MKKNHSRVTVVDIAREAGVSTQTVSRVVNNARGVAEQTRKKVQDIINKTNYRPNRAARSLASQRSLTIGLVIPNVANPYYPEIVHGVEYVAAEEGYSVLLYNTERKVERETKALQLLEEYQVAGVLLCAAALPDEELIRMLGRQQASVIINRILPGDNVGRILVDYRTGVKEAVNYLVRCGRRTIAYLSYESSRYYSNPMRLAGYTEALQEAGLDFSSELIIATEQGIRGGYEAATRLLSQRPDINAIICYNDIVAIGALRACHERGKHVPNDIALIGCDDILMAQYVSPALTSLRVSQYDLGQMAGKMLIERIRKEKKVSEIILTPNLIIRESTPKEMSIE